LENDCWKGEQEVCPHSRARCEQTCTVIQLAHRPEEEGDPQASPEQDGRAKDVQRLYQQITVDRRTQFAGGASGVSLDCFGLLSTFVLREAFHH
jgi:hypothetical protein